MDLYNNYIIIIKITKDNQCSNTTNNSGSNVAPCNNSNFLSDVKSLGKYYVDDFVSSSNPISLYALATSSEQKYVLLFSTYCGFLGVIKETFVKIFSTVRLYSFPKLFTINAFNLF